jgi:hypothetical protein
MAATFALRAAGEGFNPSKVPGAYYDCLVEMTAGTTDYAAGGYAFGVAQLQTLTGSSASMVESVEVVNHWSLSAGTGLIAALAFYAKTTGKVQAFGMAAAAGVGTGFTEIANANASMNGLTCTLRVRWH